MGKIKLDEVKKKHASAVELELEAIKQWFKDNDWIPNKIVVEEWDKTKVEYIAYLKERAIKRARQDELNA